MGFGEFGLAEDEPAEAAEFAAISVAETAEYTCRPPFDLGTHGFQQLDTFGSDIGNGLPLVFAAASAPDELARLQAIDQAGDVGGAIEHAAGDLAARMALGIDAAQDAQHVILWARDFVLGAQMIHEFIQGRSGDDDAE